MTDFKPEGWRMHSDENRRACRSLLALQEAAEQGRILEARADLCTTEHDMIVDLGFCKGLIPRAEGAIGMDDGSTRDIALISRVNKPVCFLVERISRDSAGEPLPILSRRKAQLKCKEEYLSQLLPGDVVDARVTHMENFGCFVDIGCGIPSLIPIDSISVSRIFHPSDRFRCGQDIKAVVRSIDEHGRITLTHRELLGTWEENSALFSVGETVSGIVRSVEPYGIFVELTPNLAGLAEPREGVHPGQLASVYIKSLLPEKMKVKLIIVDAFDAPHEPETLRYFQLGGHMDRWLYSPSCSSRTIVSEF